MKRAVCALVLGFVLVSSGAGAAEVPPSAVPAMEKKELKVEAQLSSSSRRHGVAAHFTDDVAYFWGCLGPCASGGEGTLQVNIPAEARSERRRVETVGTKDDPVLWVRWGTDERFYSVIVVGAQTKMKSAGRPRVVLKGWAGEKSDLKTSLTREVNGGLTVALASKEAFCGNRVSERTRVLRPEEGRFATVRAPALGAEQREGAERVEGRSWTGPLASLLALDAEGSGSAQTVVDGDRSTPWQGAFEYTEFRVPEGAEKGQWVVEFATPLTESSAFYVVSGDKIFQAEFAPSESRQYVLEFVSAEGCVAVVQPRTPAPIVEVMLTVPNAGELTTAQLVSQLEGSAPGIAEAALRLRGAEAADQMSQDYEKMSRLARGRALGIAEKLPGGVGLSVQARAVELGGPEAANAALLLKAAGRQGSKVLHERLQQADDDASAELIATLVDLDPVFAAQHLPPLLGDAGPERRAQLRQALSRLVRVPAAREAVAVWLSKAPSGTQELSPEAQVELLRALAPELENLDGGMEALGRLAESADFRRAYLLSPLLVKNFAKLRRSREILGQWMRGDVSGRLSKQERAALSVRILDGLLEHGEPLARASLRASLMADLGAENMRVRRAALFNLARTDKTSKADVQPVLDLLQEDQWPEVRAAAALAVIPVAGGALTERSERVLLRRLRRDDDATVRRSVARALSSASGENVIVELRRTFDKDEDYSVRAEAAVSLGRLCDAGSLDALTARARELTAGLTEAGPIELGLSSVTALTYINPANINKRLAPLLSEKVSGVTRQQVLRRIEAVRASPDHDLCRR